MENSSIQTLEVEMNVTSTVSPMDWSSAAYHPEDRDERPILSEEANAIAEQVVVMVMLAVTCLGIVTNVINIRVYVEQCMMRTGNSTTIGLLYLSTYDLCVCLFISPLCICHLFRYFQAVTLKITCIAYGTTMGYTHIVFSYTSAWTTVYISLERTLCVTIPTRVKQIFTPKTTAVVLTMIFLFLFILQLPYSTSTSVVWRYAPAFNQSIAYLSDSEFARTYLYYLSIFTNTVLSSISIVIVFINTVILIHKLKEFTKWRQKSKSSATANETSRKNSKNQLNTKDAELVKSMTVVTGIFLVCVAMTHIPSTVLMTLPGVSLSGINRNLFYMAHQIRFLFNTINASINFFFYVSISTQYKEAFRSVRMKCRRRQ